MGSPERAFALQKYLLLHSQHDALQKHLTGISAISPTSSTSPTRSPSRTRFGSLSSSPEANNAPFLVSNPTNIIPHHRLPSSFPFNLPTPTPTPSHLPLRSDSISPTNTSTTNQNTTFPFPAPSQNGLATSPSSFDPSELNSRLDLPRLKLNSPALIIALTGFSSQKDQEMAFEAGVDIFMTKPVRFKEVGRILEGWMKGREEEDGSGTEKIGGEEMLMGKYRKVGDEKRVVDEDGTGAKRSG